MMDIRSQEFMEFLRGEDVDCAELEDVIHAAEDVDISRVLWSLAHLRHTRDLELYKKDMPDKCRQAIQRVADLCAIQAHTDVAPQAWAVANEDAYSAAGSAEVDAWSATRSAAWSADAAMCDVGGVGAYSSEVYAVTYAVARSVSWSADATAPAPSHSAHSRKKNHYEWERDTLLALIKELMK